MDKIWTKAKFASAWLSKTSPLSSTPTTPKPILLIHRAFKGLHKVGNIFAYMRTLITADNKIMIGDLDITGGVELPAVPPLVAAHRKVVKTEQDG